MMPEFDPRTAISILRETKLDIPFIVVSGSIGEEEAVELMHAGAHDYIMKDNLHRLVPAVRRELKDARARAARKMAEERIRHLAFYDWLTDLPNQNFLLERISEQIDSNRSTENEFCLLVFELNRYAEIDHTLGPGCGEGALRQISKRLWQSCQQGEVLARLESARFALLLPHNRVEDATRRLQQAIETPVQVMGFTLHFSATMGWASFPRHGHDASSLQRRAGIALASALAKGIRFHSYTETDDPYSADRLTLLSDLHHAAESGQFFLVYQPQLDLNTSKIVGVEALIRWEHPSLGMVPPDRFIGLAESAGLLQPISAWVLRTAVRQCCDWQKHSPGLAVSVNLSSQSLLEPGLIELVDELLGYCRLSPELLKLEITESTLMQDPAASRQVIEQLSRKHIHFSIDDFGTGYSSLAYLKSLPVQELKIDKSFIIGQFQDTHDLRIVESTIGLAHNLNMEVVAEGVEDGNTSRILQKLGCDRIQGYHLARPMRADRLLQWLGASASGLGCLE